LTYVLGANQLFVEHRFFPPSTPTPLDWTDLTIFQAAGDHHRIFTALKPLLPKKWAASGASKGGMTAVYYRFFYPHDMDVTVPYVAPNSYSTHDPRYVRFLEHVGPADCRAKLKAAQRAILSHRAEITARMAAEAADQHDGF